jgi:hypothetical protein
MLQRQPRCPLVNSHSCRALIQDLDGHGVEKGVLQHTSTLPSKILGNVLPTQVYNSSDPPSMSSLRNLSMSLFISIILCKHLSDDVRLLYLFPKPYVFYSRNVDELEFVDRVQ